MGGGSVGGREGHIGLNSMAEFNLARILDDEISGLFGDHNGWTIGVAGGDCWENRCINHA